MTETIKNTHTSESRTVIDGVEYIVKSYFKKAARETAEQKILRLVRECVMAEIIKTDGAVLRSN